MAVSTREWAGRALDLTAKGLAPFVANHLPDYDGARDAASLLWVITSDGAFGDLLSEVEAGFARELLDAAGRLGDEGGAFSEPDTRRILDTAVRLLRAVGAVRDAEDADEALTEFDRLTAQTRSRRVDRASVVLPGTEGLGLKPWWQVITPHRDIREGNFNASQFAANLYNVVNGKATREYLDPREFFRRTYLTEGLKELARAGHQAGVRGHERRAGHQPADELRRRQDSLDAGLVPHLLRHVGRRVSAGSPGSRRTASIWSGSARGYDGW